ncbi:MAG: DNA repair protein RecN [Acutalibacteraceae bacterium]|nr:DNA repair protein RecN [Acutalibacteraceae bacterium]
MLNYLHIENIAVIENTELELSNGFNVLTGETGAGKSIVIDAINAVLGARTSRDKIRSGCSDAKVVAEFSQVGDAVNNLLLENGITPDESNNLLIQRVLSADGKTAFRINGQPSTVAIVKEIGRYLINIHGQHDNQSLLDPDKHCYFLDKIAENSQLIAQYYEEFKLLNTIRRELKELEDDDEAKARKIDLLQFQIEEIKQAQIKVGEFEELKERQKQAHSLESSLKTLKNAYISLVGDENAGALEQIGNALKLIEKLEFKETENLTQRLGDILENATDISVEIRNLNDRLASDEFNIEEIEDRLDLISSLMLKYGNSEQKILDYLGDSEKQLEKFRFSDQRAAELEKELLDSQDRLIAFGKKLTESRVNTALTFEKQVCEILEYLDMPYVKFKVDIKEGRYTKNGCDTVEFLISANAGESLKPLSKVASGGELSRVMLAIKSVLSDKDDVDTLIFDEIDTGISGRAANKVAFQLKKVAENRQVICVTHLAQIAACAKNHLLIEKNVSGERTYTTVTSLSYEKRIDEISRIMSGTEKTETTHNSAKELLDRSL